MRPNLWALAPGLLCVLLAGCLSHETAHKAAWLERLRPFQGPDVADVVVMDVALLERPVGDHYLNADLWDLADEQVVPLEQKSLLEENGFRVGQVGGITPPGLQALLTSERSCVNPRRIQTHAGNATTVMLGTTQVRCRYEVRQEGQVIPVELEQARCTLLVVPTLTRDGRTKLRFTPQVQHGESSLQPCPAADRSGWVIQEQRPLEDYPALAWEVSLAPNEYVLVGARYDCPESLGHQAFFQKEGPSPVQRLLVIRTGRSNLEPDPFPAPTAPAGDPAFSKSPSLAFQASYSAVRGSSR